MFKSV